MDPTNGADRNGSSKLTTSNDSLEESRTIPVGWFLQLVDKSLRINSSASPLWSEGSGLRRKGDRRRESDSWEVNTRGATQWCWFEVSEL
ncbi:hypothetical protein AVEN_183021-1 [Araneus ventricosus]|uniref:Uncharacterized protein n=1 Tax=Araneus ventricosus TaxID=182803 RepID=A0A4Y2RK13_ARAVE|nr:hypothetical protein AVEN_183021-1 [Araneus ventricosus]